MAGVVAGIGMWFHARQQDNAAAVTLGFIVFGAMIVACVTSGIFGALIPLVLKRLRADPATASSIFLTTATDVASMGTFLGKATVLLMERCVCFSADSCGLRLSCRKRRTR